MNSLKFGNLRPLGITGLFVALTLILTWPISVHPASLQMAGGTDASLYMWTIGWGTHALTHAPWSVFDANIFFPYPYTLAYSENLMGSAMLAIPIMWLTNDVLVTTNMVAVSSVLLCALGGYFLGRTLGLSVPAAFLCGLIFAFAPPRFGRLSQVHLTTVQWVPFGLAFLHRYLDKGRAKDLRWAIGMVSLQALTSGHGAALLVLGCAFVIGFHLVWGAPLSPLSRLRDVGVPGALALLPAAIMFGPYWLAGRDIGYSRGFNNAGVSSSSYFSSPSHVQEWVVSVLPSWDWLATSPDVYMFPGFLTLGLAALTFGRSALRERWLYLTMAVVTLSMAMGPPLSPWRFVHWLPGLNFIRVPSRFWILGILALAVLGAFGFERLSRQWTARRRTVAASVVALLLVGEFVMAPIESTPFVFDTTAVDRWLDTQPKPFAIAEVPVSSSDDEARRAEVATQYMLHTLAHYQPTVLGYSGSEPADYKSVYEDLIEFPSDKSIEHLTARGVTYVVVHLEYHSDEYRREYEARLATFSDRLQLVHQDGLGRVYRLPAHVRR
ncbi:MAG: hypothetical protein HQ485_14405 [Acidobacteria bacterium]|nr:hypothetical protein [Acidobacteriota bacterium]